MAVSIRIRPFFKEGDDRMIILHFFYFMFMFGMILFMLLDASIIRLLDKMIHREDISFFSNGIRLVGIPMIMIGLTVLPYILLSFSPETNSSESSMITAMSFLGAIAWNLKLFLEYRENADNLWRKIKKEEPHQKGMVYEIEEEPIKQIAQRDIDPLVEDFFNQLQEEEITLAEDMKEKEMEKEAIETLSDKLRRLANDIIGEKKHLSEELKNHVKECGETLKHLASRMDKMGIYPQGKVIHLITFIEEFLDFLKECDIDEEEDVKSRIQQVFQKIQFTVKEIEEDIRLTKTGHLLGRLDTLDMLYDATNLHEAADPFQLRQRKNKEMVK